MLRARESLRGDLGAGSGGHCAALHCTALRCTALHCAAQAGWRYCTEGVWSTKYGVVSEGVSPEQERGSGVAPVVAHVVCSDNL